MAGGFALESPRVLRIDVSGSVWIKPGASLAYRGEMSFERRPTLGADGLEEAALRELEPVVRATGRGHLYCGWQGCRIQVVHLRGERLFVAAEELIAFDETLGYEPHIVGNGVGIAAGGMVAVSLSGAGALAIGVHGEAVTLPVTPDTPIFTDPLATIAWSGELEPELAIDVSWRTLVGHGGHEPVQMRFAGTGQVMVQPFKSDRRWHPERFLRRAMRAVVPLPG
jgi:uncharacterized protein (AIM24 family)